MLSTLFWLTNFFSLLICCQLIVPSLKILTRPWLYGNDGFSRVIEAIMVSTFFDLESSVANNLDRFVSLQTSSIS